MSIDISALPSVPNGVLPTDSIIVMRPGAPTPYKAAMPTGTSSVPITSTYTASGTIAVTDKLALVNSASAVSMTLAAGATDGQVLIVKRYGAGAVTLTLTLDGTVGIAMVLNVSAVPRESLTLVWSTAWATWLLI